MHSHLKQFDKFENDLKELVTKNVSNGLVNNSNDLENGNRNENGEKNHDDEYQLENEDRVKVENGENNLMISRSSSNEDVYNDDHESDFVDDEEEEDDEEEDDEDEDEEEEEDDEGVDDEFGHNGKNHDDKLDVTNDCDNSHSFNEETEIDVNEEHDEKKDK